MSKGMIAVWLVLLLALAVGIGGRLALGDWPWQAVFAGLIAAFLISQIGYELRKADHTEGET